ncbi:MAG: helix-turn-helix domain-containing protein [Clostridia bacterium]|nr:helix-turn-helix domain-containing protein [Clostridia bacterium]
MLLKTKSELSYDEIAKLLNTSRTTIYRIRNG